MNLLLDEDLSPALVARLREHYPGIQHIGGVGLRGQSDRAVWDHAGRNGLVIVSKDNDFRQLSFVYGPPPKVVWLSVGNSDTQGIARLLEVRVDAIREFLKRPEEGLLVLEV